MRAIERERERVRENDSDRGTDRESQLGAKEYGR